MNNIRSYANACRLANNIFITATVLGSLSSAVTKASTTTESGKGCSNLRPFGTVCSKMSVSDDTYEPGSSSVAFVTTPDEECAKKLAHGLIEQKLAACVNIIPKITSVYLWEGKVNEDNEYLMMIKTRTSRINDITEWIRKNHPYDVAEVISLPIENGNAPYMSWIAKTVPDKQ